MTRCLYLLRSPVRHSRRALSELRIPCAAHPSSAAAVWGGTPASPRQPRLSRAATQSTTADRRSSDTRRAAGYPRRRPRGDR